MHRITLSLMSVLEEQLLETLFIILVKSGRRCGSGRGKESVSVRLRFGGDPGATAIPNGAEPEAAAKASKETKPGKAPKVSCGE